MSNMTLNMLWFVLMFGMLVAVSGCVTARHWQPNTHQDMMLMCNEMCSERVKKYSPLTGSCSCHEEP